MHAGPIRTMDSLDLPAGWNLVGTISESVLVSSVQTVPAGALGSAFFTYDGLDYVTGETLIPGDAYWIKMTEAGTLIFSAPVPPVGILWQRIGEGRRGK
jgi:hypothetical protein